MARAAVAEVRDDPLARLSMLHELYEVPASVDRGYLPFRRAAAAFMNWQLRRGLLNPADDPRPGSPWWRAVNEAFLRDTAEARALAFGHPGSPSRPAVNAHLEFIATPTARRWYRAHNTTIAAAYLEHEDLALREDRVERFFINVVLVRVLFAHALVAAPRLALAWLAPVGRAAGDPRVGMTGIFLSLSRVLPDTYPLGDDVNAYVAVEHGFGRLLDVGIITPRIRALYQWSASELGRPELRGLLDGPTPAYAWDTEHAEDAAVWQFRPSRLARLARRVLPAPAGFD
jgi:hypothetical protein